LYTVEAVSVTVTLEDPWLVNVIVLPEMAVTLPSTRGRITPTVVASRSVWFGSMVPSASTVSPAVTDDAVEGAPP
jgi:hypothetical protein